MFVVSALWSDAQSTPRELENVVAFTRVYGVIRFSIQAMPPRTRVGAA
jgi:hypothetical protein